MSATLKTLLGWLILVALGSLALDWQETARQRQQESEASSRVRQRLESQTRDLDWSAMALQASQAQDAWLDRLVAVESTGVFRAVAMERMADLCKSLDVPCQVGAVGEKVLSSPTDKTNPGAPAKALPGMISATVRVTFPVSNPGLHALLTEIETGTVLRSIDKFTVRAGRVEMLVQNFGMDQTALDKLRAPANTPAGSRP
jgi:hypothetical protein